MANPVPAGSDVSAGTYKCTSCGDDVGSTTHLPPCPKCGNGQWETVTGGDSVNDPYPDGRANKQGGQPVPPLPRRDRRGNRLTPTRGHGFEPQAAAVLAVTPLRNQAGSNRNS